ncbi:MAG TPA: addiction module protein [Pirellulaceae bacterium]|nr:addiction module protein [Pirellulaceae bacterium]
MTQAALDLREQLARLPQEDRAALAKFLLESLDDEVDEDAEAAWAVELERRAAAVRAGTATGRPAMQALDELRAKHS